MEYPPKANYSIIAFCSVRRLFTFDETDYRSLSYSTSGDVSRNSVEDTGILKAFWSELKASVKASRSTFSSTSETSMLLYSETVSHGMGLLYCVFNTLTPSFSVS